jgi:hypothetical protein
MAGLLRDNVRRADEMAQQLLESTKRVSLLEERANTTSMECQNLLKDKDRYMESVRKNYVYLNILISFDSHFILSTFWQ